MLRQDAWCQARWWWPVLLVLLTGCSVMRGRSGWCPPLQTAPGLLWDGESEPGALLQRAEQAYEAALNLEYAGDETCVDRYYETAQLAWQELSSSELDEQSLSSRASELYHSALMGLVDAGQHFSRLDPRVGLIVKVEGERILIPAVHHGFPWQSQDFDSLILVGDYETKDLNNLYRSCGYGIPTVVKRFRQTVEFRRDEQFFAATVLLRPTDSNSDAASPAVLEFHDPLRVEYTTIDNVHVPLHRDHSAPIAYLLNFEEREFVRGFVQPGSTAANTGLFMIEPYQPGKIPVVFVHGLLSDPFAWANTANELRARPDVLERYQIWGFEYPTGEPFLVSAAELRRQLMDAVAILDPMGQDPALSQIVLVGHSMGGLVSKLQVTSSEHYLWDAVSKVPLEEIVTPPETRFQLEEAFYFEPLPIVSRVVFIGTPHHGAPSANRPYARLMSHFVNEPSSMQEEHAQIVRDNPGVFSRQFTRRIPTSVDLLKPQSPLLNATNKLQYAPYVALHSIIGRGYWSLHTGPSDKVVPVSSASLLGVDSELQLKSKHAKIPSSDEAIEELVRILRNHG